MQNIFDNLVTPPNDLCFNCSEFSRENFSVDQFLQDHRNLANLETMRDDLGIYLKFLRSAMIELINQDYADFVNLSSNLIGLDKAINCIQLPLGQLKEELLVVKQHIEDALKEVSEQLLRRKKIQERKSSLKSLNRVHHFTKKLVSSFNGFSDAQESTILLERASTEYNQLKFHASRCSSDLSDDDNQNIIKIEDSLFARLDDHFVRCIENNNQNELFRVLEMYLSLGNKSRAEEFYRKVKISPAMETLINEEALVSNPRGLTGVYNSLIGFIDSDMNTLRLTAQKLSFTSGFEFVVNSFWPEVEERLELNLPSIYAPGNPDSFFMCFSETVVFLDSLANRCDSRSLRAHPQYHNFLQRWNLPVYYQIRFQDIASDVERGLGSLEVEVQSTEWRLTATAGLWRGLLQCWAEKVFITQLTHRFWKLSLQILGRFYTWINQLVEKKCDDGSLKIDTWVFLYSDLAALTERFGELFTIAIGRLHPGVSQGTRENLHQCLEEWKRKFVSQQSVVSSRLVQSVCADSVIAARQVSEVPRLYRRTNRDPPTKSLPYIDAMLELPLTFHTNHRAHPQITTWLQSVFSQITKQYYLAVMDVLTSVQKTEESLRKLKKMSHRSSASIPDRGGDDDKIRMQLYFDANYYCKKIEEVEVKRENVDHLKDLLKLVETLHSKNGIK